MHGQVKLAQLAVAAAVTPYTLDRIADLARPSRHSQPVPYDDTVLPMWERQTLGQVRRAATAANEFLDVLESWNLRPVAWDQLKTGRVTEQ